jgi:protein-S-isoprenylcysteine O-methyltransferase Ste14
LTFFIALFALWLDESLGFTGMFESPSNWYVAAFSFVTGFILWLWTYEQLTRLGEGSPSPTAGRTIKLVKTGIYAHSRNPSIFGKLMGVLAVGFALNSTSFVFILVPILLTGSLIEKVWRQEPQLVEIFGEEYEKYRKEVPLFFPWKLLLFDKSKSPNSAS